MAINPVQNIRHVVLPIFDMNASRNAFASPLISYLHIASKAPMPLVVSSNIKPTPLPNTVVPVHPLPGGGGGGGGAVTIGYPL